MKITKITINVDDGSSADYQNPKGLDLGDIVASVGDDISGAASDTLPGMIAAVLTGVIGILMRRFKLSI